MEEATVPQFDLNGGELCLNVAGTAMMNGKYAIVDDDEVAITLDPTSLTVNVDPQAIKYQSNIFTESQNLQSTLCYRQRQAISHL